MKSRFSQLLWTMKPSIIGMACAILSRSVSPRRLKGLAGLARS
ncbi:Uncharacterised protein [Bordetella pertussis]|nr:Uncharacterised protein [Bordetella pertussis]CFU82760.1 Uncharacterised protein [Bordetella pertussis]CPO43534.1 Uncharacterised protein [Bordetella pertussis]